MSEYQYYEFAAIDRPLTRAEMAELRAVSTRAVITPAGFVNHYEWGGLKADPADWMRRYFDAFSPVNRSRPVVGMTTQVEVGKKAAD